MVIHLGLYGFLASFSVVDVSKRRVNVAHGIGLVVLYYWAYQASSHSWCFIAGRLARLYGSLASPRWWV